ncbi:hypothetical protein ABGB18_41335 [Nonomuraea sp. B12E4]|uniref:hypothetical protein n=1 Tax=Nonomuraea sp. B12E4 TaxID=3153564 RepID=UPI00325F7217
MAIQARKERECAQREKPIVTAAREPAEVDDPGLLPETPWAAERRAVGQAIRHELEPGVA